MWTERDISIGVRLDLLLKYARCYDTSKQQNDVGFTMTNRGRS